MNAKLTTVSAAFFFLCAVSGCSKRVCCEEPLVFRIYFTVKSPAGDDLLNPANSHAFTEDSVEVYYLQDGSFQRLFDPRWNNPKGLSITQQDGKDYVLGCTLSQYVDNQRIATTLVQFGQRTPDTVRIAFRLHDNVAASVEQAWVNGYPDPAISKPFALIK